MENGTLPPVDDMLIAYQSTGKGLKINGFEIEVIGQIQENWKISAGYTYVNSVSSADADPTGNVPQNQMKLFSSYTFPERLWAGADKLTVGGGLNWQSKISEKWYNAPENGYNGGTIVQPSYYLASAFANYKFSDQLTGSLNINNLFDEKYYLNVGTFNGIYWGEPRNVTLTLRAKF